MCLVNLDSNPNLMPFFMLSFHFSGNILSNDKVILLGFRIQELVEIDISVLKLNMVLVQWYLVVGIQTTHTSSPHCS